MPLPDDFAPGDVIRAADLNAIKEEVAAASGTYAPKAAVAARYRFAGTQATAAHTASNVAWDTVVREDGISNSLPASTLVLPSAGWYLIEAGLRWASDSTGGYRRLAIIDGAGAAIAQNEVVPLSTPTLQGVAVVAYFAAGSLSFIVQATQGAGALNIESFSHQTHVAVTRIGD